MAACTPDGMTDKTKIHGVVEAVELPLTVGKGGQRHGTRGDTYAEESDVSDDLCEDTRVLGFWALHRTCVFDVHIVET